MNLEILISTCNERILQAQDVVLDEQEGVRYLIVHQIFDYVIENSVRYAADKLKQRSDVRVVTVYSKGLSRNRNTALENAEGDILLISDDDARYTEQGLIDLSAAFESAPAADILTFKITTPEGKDYKRYKSLEFDHNRISVLRVSSLEIAMRRKSVIGNSLRFEEQFGLGAKYPACEEAVFLANALNLDLSVAFKPVDIVVHPLESSGRSWSTDDSVRVRGALFRRIFGWAGLPLLAVFAIKQRPGYLHRYSLRHFLSLSVSSFLRFKP